LWAEKDGEVIKELGCGALENRNCVRCTYPEQYEEYNHFDTTDSGLMNE